MKATLLAFILAAYGWRPAGADQVGTSSCTGGECTQLKSPLITGVYPESGSPCGGTKLTIYGEHFLMPSGENPWDSQTVFVGTKECHIHAHYTNSTQIFCIIENTDNEACFSLAGDDRAVAVVVTIWGGMGDYTQTLLEDGFTFRSDEALRVSWASSWSATNGDVLCLAAADSNHHRRRREHRRRRWTNPSQDHLNVTIGDTYCQMDWCETMYESEDECGVSYNTCMAQHAGDEKKQKGCEANANYCEWKDESCQPILRDGSEWSTFHFCCKVADSAEVGAGNYQLGVYVAPSDHGTAGNGHGDQACSRPRSS